MNRKLTDGDIETARGMLKRGRTKTDVAKALGVSRRALGFALERVPAPSPDPAPVADPAEDDDRDLTAAELGLSDDAGVAEIDAQIARCKRNQEAAEAEGDLAEQRQQANQIRQFLALRKRNAADPDAITIPRDQLEATREAARKKFTHMLKDRPLLCAHCSKALSVSWARDPLAPPAAGKDA